MKKNKKRAFLKKSAIKTTLSLIVVLTFLFSGCTSVHLMEPSEASYSKTNSELQGKKVQITLTNGETIKAEQIEITDHAISYNNLDLQSRQTVPVSKVNEITFKNRGRSALAGFAIGAFIGAPIGALLSYVGAAVSEHPDPGSKAIPGALVYGVGTGLVLGLPIGAAIGSKDKYMFTIPADSSATIPEPIVQQ
jgi:hypothetical protein